MSKGHQRKDEPRKQAKTLELVFQEEEVSL